MIIIVIIGLFVIFTGKVYAYLDPGSGSYVFQIAIGGVLAGIYLLKKFWRNIKRLFNKLFLRQEKGGKNNE